MIRLTTLLRYLIGFNHWHTVEHGVSGHLFNRCRGNVEDLQKKKILWVSSSKSRLKNIAVYLMFIEVPPEYPTCRSVMAGINDSEIPHCLYSALLPHPDVSISDFLSFELPAQFDSLFGIEHIKIQDFWSKARPMCINLENVQRLRKLPIPSSAVLDSFQEEFTHFPDQHKIKSIIYNHLPSSNPAASTRFPLWVFNYWVQVSQLHAYARGPWNRAQHWAANQHLTRFPERRRLSNEIHAPLTGRVIYHTYVIRLQVWYKKQSKHKLFLIYHTTCPLFSALSLPIYLFKLSLLESVHEGHAPSRDPWQTRLRSLLRTTLISN